jgi:hypothetical protein
MTNHQAVEWAALAVVAALVTVGVNYTRSSAQPAVPTCVTDEDRVHIRALLLAAVDEAWKEQAKHLFTSWLKDTHGQPERASAGIQSSIVAYQRARDQALKWSPAAC